MTAKDQILFAITQMEWATLAIRDCPQYAHDQLYTLFSEMDKIKEIAASLNE
jgi:hypothetical protein